MTISSPHHAVSQIAVYDVDGDGASAFEVPCPGLNIVSQDENGNLYFSNGSSAVMPPLFSSDAPDTCLVRIPAGQTEVDADFTLAFADVTDGRQAGTFQYIGGGKGVFQVFHDELVTITPDSDPFEISSTASWRAWLMDVDARTAAPMEGLDTFGGQFTAFVLGGRTFILLPAADYASTTVYEVLEDGGAVVRFETVGWAYNLIQVQP